MLEHNLVSAAGLVLADIAPGPAPVGGLSPVTIIAVILLVVLTVFLIRYLYRKNHH